MGVADAASSGDQRKALEALRDELATALEAADPNVKAQLAAQLRATLADLRALPSANPRAAQSGVVTIDEAKQRRADRQSGAAAQPSSTTGGRKRG